MVHETRDNHSEASRRQHNLTKICARTHLIIKVIDFTYCIFNIPGVNSVAYRYPLSNRGVVFGGPYVGLHREFLGSGRIAFSYEVLHDHRVDIT